MSYSVVVVDNDQAQSAQQIVRDAIAATPRIKIRYYWVEEQNISLTRNKTIEMATGDLVAFIDDDQYPEEDWLSRLYRTHKDFQADVVLGTIRPHFPDPPPVWIARGGLFDRSSFPTGTIMKLGDAKHMRTGNILFRRSMIRDGELAFDPAFGRTGGEDQDFFRRKLAEGFIFAWCDEALVHETFPVERFTRAYFLRRALRRGSTEAHLSRLTVLSVGKSIVAVLVYSSMLPVLFISGHHRFMRFLIKDCDHIGKLLAACGLTPVKSWPIQVSISK